MLREIGAVTEKKKNRKKLIRKISIIRNVAAIKATATIKVKSYERKELLRSSRSYVYCKKVIFESFGNFLERQLC